MTIFSHSAAKPVRAVGDFFAMALDTLVLIGRRRFDWREFQQMLTPPAG